MPGAEVEETNKSILKRFVTEVWNRGNLDIVDECTAEGFVQHNVVSEKLLTKDDFKRDLAALRAAFPDLQFAVDDLLADGDKVLARWTIRGTHLGAFQGFPPTGKKIVVSGMNIVRFTDGKASEEWVNIDMFGMMQQLGVIPSPEGGLAGLLRAALLGIRRSRRG